MSSLLRLRIAKKDTRPFWFIVLGATPAPFSVSQDYIVLPLVLRLDLSLTCFEMSYKNILQKILRKNNYFEYVIVTFQLSPLSNFKKNLERHRVKSYSPHCNINPLGVLLCALSHNVNFVVYS